MTDTRSSTGSATLATIPTSLPEDIQAHLFVLEEFIGDCDGKETVISSGDTCIDDGTIDAGDAVVAFNGIVAALSAPAQAARNWDEDASHENGNYECRCCECDQMFIGHKRRVLCKACSNLLTPPQPASNAYASLESALRTAFPHFQNDEPITPDAIRAIGREFTDMVMGWEPQKTEIEFADNDGKIRKIIFEPGDYEVGITPGWVLEDDESVDAAQRQPEPKTLCGMIKAVYSDLDAEDCSFIDFEWARLRGYILPNNGTGQLEPVQDVGKGEAVAWLYEVAGRSASAIDRCWQTVVSLSRPLESDWVRNIEPLDRAAPQSASNAYCAPDREAIARIIDPELYARWDRKRLVDTKADKWFELTHPQELTAARAKADAILALSSTQSGDAA